jgi:hypothetical protein
MVALQDLAQNPAKMVKYQNNPKVMNLISKLSAKFGGQNNAHLTKSLLKEKQSRSLNGCHNNTNHVPLTSLRELGCFEVIPFPLAPNAFETLYVVCH